MVGEADSGSYAIRVVLPCKGLRGSRSMDMDFEWDEAKSDRNRRERGFGYDFAASIFEGPVVEWSDVRETWGEARVVAIGSADGLVLAVIYTDRDGVRRIISARRARKKEEELWRWCVSP